MTEFKKSTAREYFESIVVAVILALFIRTFVVQAFKIPTGSMEENLLIGDHLLVNKFVFGPTASGAEKAVLPITDIKRGDVIVFKYPVEPERDFIKRVIGLPGETVEVKERKIYINGAAIDDPHAHYLLPASSTDYHEVTSFDVRERYGPVTVPAEPLLRDGRQPRQLAGQPLLGFSAARARQGEGARDLLVVRVGAGRVRGGQRRRHHPEPGVGLHPLLHPDALVAHAAPDPLMIKLAIKLAIAALIANAAWQAGRTFAAHYQFRDEVRQAALIRGQTDAQLQQRVLELAANYDIPLTRGRNSRSAARSAMSMSRVPTCASCRSRRAWSTRGASTGKSTPTSSTHRRWNDAIKNLEFGIWNSAMYEFLIDSNSKLRLSALSHRRDRVAHQAGHLTGQALGFGGDRIDVGAVGDPAEVDADVEASSFEARLEERERDADVARSSPVAMSGNRLRVLDARRPTGASRPAERRWPAAAHARSPPSSRSFRHRSPWAGGTPSTT